MSKHTPGSWAINAPHAARSHSRQILDAEGHVVAECAEWHSGTGRCADANARLIAAAPETAAERDRLRAALRDLRDRFADHAQYDEDDAAAIQAADAALANTSPAPTESVNKELLDRRR